MGVVPIRCTVCKETTYLLYDPIPQKEALKILLQIVNEYHEDWLFSGDPGNVSHDMNRALERVHVLLGKETCDLLIAEREANDVGKVAMPDYVVVGVASEGGDAVEVA